MQREAEGIPFTKKRGMDAISPMVAYFAMWTFVITFFNMTEVNTICMIKTPISAISVAAEAPVAPKKGISIRLRTKSITAPTITDIRTFFSLLRGVITCMPRTLVIPIGIIESV